MQYTQVTITIRSDSNSHTRHTGYEPFRDMLIYSLGDEGPYDSFEETADGLNAYVPTSLFDEAFLDAAINELKLMDQGLRIAWQANVMPDKDYNEEWEKQHQPVLVGDFCWVRAPFHPHRDDVRYEIEIEPKMSFGTAHHATTYMMLSFLEEQEVTGKTVLDMGSGTGVLAILAAKKGAARVDAIDVDEWAFRNAQENFERNAVNVNAILGDASSLGTEPRYDLILANINRNILLRDMEAYFRVLKAGGTVLMSGFYQHDIDAIAAKASSFGLHLAASMSRDDWAAIRLLSE